MREKFICTALFALLSLHGLSQNKQAPESVNQLTIEIIDVAERHALSDLDLLICHENDTLKTHLDAAGVFTFDLPSSGKYSVTVIKAGYDTLYTEWENPAESAEQVLEFYMPKTQLTRKEKRKAHQASKNLPEPPCENCGGFERIAAGYNEMCVVRYRYAIAGESSGTSYEFRKLKYY